MPSLPDYSNLWIAKQFKKFTRRADTLDKEIKKQNWYFLCYLESMCEPLQSRHYWHTLRWPEVWERFIERFLTDPLLLSTTKWITDCINPLAHKVLVQRISYKYITERCGTTPNTFLLIFKILVVYGDTKKIIITNNPS